jgi:DNA-binding response OmpR family regulator
MLKKSIIIVDDELLIRDLLYDFFCERNWNVSVCESGEKSAEVLRSRVFDLALIDIKMPDIDGIALARKIRNLSPTLPIIFMTAFPSVESAVEALHLKAEDYYIKPFNINKLYKAIEDLVERRRAIEEAARI